MSAVALPNGDLVRRRPAPGDALPVETSIVSTGAALPFLDNVLALADPEHQAVVSFRTSSGLESQSFTTDNLEVAAARIEEESTAGHDVYLRITVTEKSFNGARRGGEDDTAAVVSLVADLDVGGAGHFDSKAAAVEWLHSLEHPPSVIIDSGGGVHAWWLLDELVLTPTPEARDEVKTASRRFHGWLQAQAPVGVKLDSVYDLSRVMRVPGTMNWKTGSPRPVSVIESTGRRHSLAELVEDAPAVEPATIGPAVANGGQFHELSAEDLERLRGLIDGEPEIRSAWERTRKLPGKNSASEWDQSFANLLVSRGGVREEEFLIGALVEYRRKHREDLKPRNAQYFIRTAAKALEAAEASAPESAAGGLDRLDELWNPISLSAFTVAPPARAWLFKHPSGDGLIPLGRAGILAGAGGAGKTHALIGGAIAIATGRSWLGHFRVPEEVVGRHVALLLGEEEIEEADRRLYRIAEALRLTNEERWACAKYIRRIPLAGIQCQLTELVNGHLVETDRLEWVRRMLNQNEEGWALVAIDPLSRFAGGDVENSNESATRFMQAVESLCRAPGNPSVLVSTHSSKLSRREGGADVRGVTGLTDAARWVATISGADDNIEFAQYKSNYSRRMDPLPLMWEGGILQALGAADLVAREAKLEAEKSMKYEKQVADRMREILVEMRDKYNGTFQGSKTSLIEKYQGRNQLNRSAFDQAVSLHYLDVSGSRQATLISITSEGLAHVQG